MNDTNEGYTDEEYEAIRQGLVAWTKAMARLGTACAKYVATTDEGKPVAVMMLALGPVIPVVDGAYEAALQAFDAKPEDETLTIMRVDEKGTVTREKVQ